MILLWCAVAILTFAWFAGDAVLVGIVAPQLFQHARAEHVGDAFAGLVFGDLLGNWVAIAGICCVIPVVCMLAAASGRALKLGGKRAAWLPVSACLIILLVHVTTVTMVKYGTDVAADLRAHPDAQREEEFKTTYHQRSRLVFGLEMLTALGVTIGAALAARRAGSAVAAVTASPSVRAPRTTA